MNTINKDTVKSVLQEFKQGLHVREIATQIINTHNSGLFENSLPDLEKVTQDVNKILLQDTKKSVGNIFVKVKNPKTKKDKKGYYKLKTIIKTDKIKEKPDKPVKPTLKTDTLPTSFIGKAGECAVMSELLFRGYNVNSMLVDDGVDIVASKDNVFFYLQVKTTSLTDKNKIYAPVIKQNNFNNFLGTQMRYVIVARCYDVNNMLTNRYFVFSNNDIQRYIHYNVINSSDNGIHIKIEIDEKDGKPYIYHDSKRTLIDFHLNNFEL